MARTRSSKAKRSLQKKAKQPRKAGAKRSRAAKAKRFGLISERGSERRVCQYLASAMCDHRLGSWDEIVMPSMPGDALATSLLCSELYSRRIEASCEIRHEAPYIPLPASWEAYLAALSSERRYLVRRSLRDFEREVLSGRAHAFLAKPWERACLMTALFA